MDKDEMIQFLSEQVETLTKTIEEQTKLISELRQQIAELSERIGKNSKNSSNPRRQQMWGIPGERHCRSAVWGTPPGTGCSAECQRRGKREPCSRNTVRHIQHSAVPGNHNQHGTPLRKEG